ncbi:MAG TPA: 1,4-beta-xylanase [Chitinophagaceae bacterium]|jgi:acetyl esterase/lipase|nr:1,4-beta-xylanase [Chitinophagaceae bacterium]
MISGFFQIRMPIIFLLVVCSSLLHAQSDSLVLPLWKNGAPGFENRKNEPEEAKDYWVKNINNPSLTVFFPPAGTANGTAVLICPGGGHRLLVYKAEGLDPAKYLNTLGITAIILKYRLAREPNSPYSLDKQPQEDAYRAMRLVRSHYKEWKIDTSRLGMLGFSAGGEVVDAIAFGSGNGNPQAPDPVDRLNGRPDFIMQVYPGPLYIPDTVPHDAPPAFLLAANDDACCSVTVISLLEKYRQAKVSVEAHILAHGDHGFNMGNRSSFLSVKSWPGLMANWLLDNKWVAPVQPGHDSENLKK